MNLSAATLHALLLPPPAGMHWSMGSTTPTAAWTTTCLWRARVRRQLTQAACAAGATAPPSTAGCGSPLTCFLWSTAICPAVVEEPPLHVVHVAVEMAPICKVCCCAPLYVSCLFELTNVLLVMAGEVPGLHCLMWAAGEPHTSVFLISLQTPPASLASHLAMRAGRRPGRRGDCAGARGAGAGAPGGGHPAQVTACCGWGGRAAPPAAAAPAGGAVCGCVATAAVPSWAARHAGRFATSARCTRFPAPHLLLNHNVLPLPPLYRYNFFSQSPLLGGTQVRPCRCCGGAPLASSASVLCLCSAPLAACGRPTCVCFAAGQLNHMHPLLPLRLMIASTRVPRLLPPHFAACSTRPSLTLAAAACTSPPALWRGELAFCWEGALGSGSLTLDAVGDSSPLPPCNPPSSPSPAHNPLPRRLRCFFIQPQNGMFDGAVYQGYSDGQRFDFFCRVSRCWLWRGSRGT